MLAPMKTNRRTDNIWDHVYKEYGFSLLDTGECKPPNEKKSASTSCDRHGSCQPWKQFSVTRSRKIMGLKRNRQLIKRLMPHKRPYTLCTVKDAITVKGETGVVFVGSIPGDYIRKINAEIDAISSLASFQPLDKLNRHSRQNDALTMQWESYYYSNVSSQHARVCYADGHMDRDGKKIPMPGRNESDRDELPGAPESIINLIDQIHEINPDIAKIFGKNAIRHVAINEYYSLSGVPDSTGGQDLCLDWHVDRPQVGQFVACINLQGMRNTLIRKWDDITTIASNKPGDIYIFDGTQYDHAVHLTQSVVSRVLVLRSPFVPHKTNSDVFFECNKHFRLPDLEKLFRIKPLSIPVTRVSLPRSSE